MILVTASTGKIGSLIVSEFAARGVPSRALIRDRSHARDLPGIEWVVGDYEDDASMDGALDGVTMMYLACGESGRKVALEKRAIDAVVRNAVGHVIKVSASDAATA